MSVGAMRLLHKLLPGAYSDSITLNFVTLLTYFIQVFLALVQMPENHVKDVGHHEEGRDLLSGFSKP